jgi:hypothetical protein
MQEKLANTPITEFEAFSAEIQGKEHRLLYDKASDLVVILNYAPGRSLIYKGHKLNELVKLSDEELANHPEAKMCMAENSELETSTPAELFESIL